MILLLDNYDSFTYNIADALGSLGKRVLAVRSDTIDVAGVASLAPEAIIISPGPGRPEDAGVSSKVIEQFAGRIPVLGVCLGHQCIAEVFGAKVVRARLPVHGKVWDIFHDGRTIYDGLPSPFRATRYHSLVADLETVSAPLEVSARSAEGEVMGLRCPELGIEGVQFHPESIATPDGATIFRNFLGHYLSGRVAA